MQNAFDFRMIGICWCLAWILGGAMAVTAWAEPITLVGIPHEGLTTTAISKINPVGATTTANEADLSVEASAGGSNVADVNGNEGGRPVPVGNPSSSSLSWTLTGYDGGAPGNGATYTRTDSQGTYGASELLIPTRFDSIAPVVSGNGNRTPSAVALPNGAIGVVYEEWASPGDKLYFRKWDPTTKTWGSAVVVADTNTGTTYPPAFSSAQPIGAAIWSVPSNVSSGSVIYVGWWATVSASTIRWRVTFSIDGGATWGTSRDTTLTRAYSSTTYDETRVVYDPVGQSLTMVIRSLSGGTYTGETWVADPRGAQWKSLSSGNVSNMRAHTLWNYCGTIYHAWIVDAGNAIQVARRTSLSSGWESVNTDAISGTNMEDIYQLAAAVDPSGRVTLFARGETTDSDIYQASSVDGGKNWGAESEASPSGGDAWDVINDQSGAAALTSGLLFRAAVYTGGQIHLIGHMISTGTVDNSVSEIIFGDRSTLSFSGTVGAIYRSTWAQYYPSDIPASKGSGWTYTGTTGQSLTVASGSRLAWSLDNTNDTGYASAAYSTTDNAAGFLVAFSRDCAYGGGAIPVMRVAQNDATDEIIVEVRIDWTARTVRLYDVVAAASLGTAAVNLNSGDIEVYIEVDANTTVRKVSAWTRSWAENDWTVIATNQSLTNQVGTSAYVRMGKISATTAELDVLYAFLTAPSSLATGDVTSARRGMRAHPQADYVDGGVSVRWEGAPVFAGNTWSVIPVSATPIGNSSPWSVRMSPSIQWVSSSASSGDRIVYDLGSGWRSKFSSNLAWVGFANYPGVASITLQSYTGAGMTDEIVLSGHTSPLGASGSVRWTRASTSSLLFRANGANGTPRVYRRDECAGWWCVVVDDLLGTNQIAGYIAHNDEGQFDNTSGTLQMTVELDASTVTAVSGSLGAMATSTTTGTIAIYPPDAVAFGVLSNEAQRYVAFEIELALGMTAHRAGLIGAGPAMAFARQEEAGATVRVLSADEVVSLGASRVQSSYRVARRAPRMLEMQWDRQLSHEGQREGASRVSAKGYNTTTARALLDNAPDTLETLHRVIGQRAPIVVATNVSIGADFGTSATVVGGDQVFWGLIQPEWTRTASHGQLFGRGHGHEASGRLVLTEVI